MKARKVAFRPAKVAFGLRMQVDLYQRLSAVAEKQFSSVSAVIAQCVDGYLPKLEHKEMEEKRSFKNASDLQLELLNVA